MNYNYKIRIKYQTGDSFQTYDTSDVLEISWKTVEKAEENLMRIKAHHDFFKKLDSYRISAKEKQQLEEEYSAQDWATPIHKGAFGGVSHQKFSMILFTDDGKPFQLGTYWMGYFESVDYAEIFTELPRIEF